MNGSCVDERNVKWRFGLVVLLGIALGWLGPMGCASAKKEPDYRLMTEAWNTIQREYVGRAALDPNQLTYGAINGMVDSLGDTGHSTFLTPQMVKELRRMETGQFKGIGIEVQTKGERVVIVAPLDGSPAQRAGLRPGDIILKVSNEDVTDWPLARVVERIGGRVGTKVTLTVEDPRSGRTREVTMARASIKLQDITWQRLPGTSIVHLRLAGFDKGVTKDLKKALTKIQSEGATGLILDLRNNPGGLLNEAISFASQFLKEGIVLMARNAKGEVSPVPVEKGGVATEIPLVVLVNEGSASAAEIVAGALRDNGRAELVGETTFGTGTVLQEFRLSDGSALMLAIEEWLTPKGNSFWHKGIKPQYEVRLPQDVMPLFPLSERDMTPEQLEASEDRQLLTALRLLNRERKPPELNISAAMN